MDQKTLAAYDSDAAAFAKDWLEQPAPVDLHEIVERFPASNSSRTDLLTRKIPLRELIQRKP